MIGTNSFTMIRRFPEFGVIPMDSPLVNNTFPVYLGKEVDNRKISKVEKGREQVSSPPSKPKTPEIQIEGRHTADQLIAFGKQERPFLMEKLLPKNAICFLAGEGDVGKSLFYLNLSLAIVSGKDEFIGLKLNAQHKRVLIVSTEDDKYIFGMRIIMQLSGESLSSAAEKNLVVYMDKRNIYENLAKELKARKYDLLIIDSFGDFVDGRDINSSSIVRSFLDRFKEMIIDYDISVLLVHHLGKGRHTSLKNRLLGSVGIVDDARNLSVLEKVPDRYDIRKLTISKANYLSEGEKNIPMILKFHEQSLTYSRSDEILNFKSSSGSEKQKPGRKGDKVRDAKIMRLASEGMKLKDIAEEVGLHKSSVSRIIKQNKIKFNTGELGPEP